MIYTPQHRTLTEQIPRWIFTCVAYSAVMILASIFIFLAVAAFGAIRSIGFKDFFLSSNWNPTSYHTPGWGIFSLLWSTFWVSFISLCIAVPLGLAIAVYLAEIASASLREIVKPVIEMIASIPTVILGLLGILFVGPAVAKIFGLSNGLNILTASILVAVATLPTIASISEDALSSVSGKLRQASLALGATGWDTILRVVIPAASRGIIAACMLGLGRVIGETMIVLMVAGNSRAIPMSLLDAARPMTANIAIEIKEVVIGSLHWQSLFAIALTLFIFTFAINFTVDVLIHKKTVV